MRLPILDHGHSLGTKTLFALIRAVSRQPILDIVKLVRYRPDFFAAQAVTHEAMRGPSSWSVGDRELMAAFVAKMNQCEWCTRAHTAVAGKAYHDPGRVEATISDIEAAPIQDSLRATLRMLRKLCREHTLTPDDVRAVLSTGVSREQVEDALAVCFAFNITVRLANTFGFTLASQEAFDSGANYLLKRGHR